MRYLVTFRDDRPSVTVDANSVSANQGAAQFWQDGNLVEREGVLQEDYNRPYVPPRLIAIYSDFDSVTLLPEDPAI